MFLSASVFYNKPDGEICFWTHDNIPQHWKFIDCGACEAFVKGKQYWYSEYFSAEDRDDVDSLTSESMDTDTQYVKDIRKYLRDLYNCLQQNGMVLNYCIQVSYS